MTQFEKCSVDQGLFVKPCQALEGVTDNFAPGFSKARGVSSWQLTNIKLMKPARTYWGIKSKNHPKGFLFNFCPFCGEDISAPFSELGATK